jgi:GT2 family glycosyltransferase
MLIPSAVMQSEYCYFDRFFNNGGEDTDFCFRIKSANFQIRFSSLAVLYEVENQDKYSASYILGRTVNDAVNYSLIVKRNSSFCAICIRLIKMSLRVIQNYTLHVLAGQSNAKYLSNMAALKALLSGKRP